VVGVEALIRWHQAEAGMAASERFVPLAEERGLIEPIGAWALRAAGAQLLRWQSDGLATGGIAVTLSARELLRRDPGENPLQLIGVSGRDIGVAELVHDARGAQGETERLDLGRLVALGARVTIDDVIADRASLRQLKRLPVDFLKLDGSFAQRLEREPWDTAIVTSAIELGHDLGFRTVAEGVETGRQFGFLRRQGCDAVQGNLVCPPLPSDAFAAWLRGRNNKASLASAAGA
jgi:EAL domain-containing protein (putative c-di-GMP-specific phosphodiesterase class I)